MELGDLDIYNDLDAYHAEEEKKNSELKALEEKNAASLKVIEELQLENKTLLKKIKTIEINFQNLLDTAKAEIKRKDQLIAQLRKEKDDLCFRRQHIKPKPTHTFQDYEQQFFCVPQMKQLTSTSNYGEANLDTSQTACDRNNKAPANLVPVNKHENKEELKTGVEHRVANRLCELKDNECLTESCAAGWKGKNAKESIVQSTKPNISQTSKLHTRDRGSGNREGHYVRENLSTKESHTPLEQSSHQKKVSAHCRDHHVRDEAPKSRTHERHHSRERELQYERDRREREQRVGGSSGENHQSSRKKKNRQPVRERSQSRERKPSTRIEDYNSQTRRSGSESERSSSRHAKREKRTKDEHQKAAPEIKTNEYNSWTKAVYNARQELTNASKVNEPAKSIRAEKDSTKLAQPRESFKIDSTPETFSTSYEHCTDVEKKDQVKPQLSKHTAVTAESSTNINKASEDIINDLSETEKAVASISGYLIPFEDPTVCSIPGLGDLEILNDVAWSKMELQKHEPDNLVEENFVLKVNDSETDTDRGLALKAGGTASEASITKYSDSQSTFNSIDDEETVMLESNQATVTVRKEHINIIENIRLPTLFELKNKTLADNAMQQSMNTTADKNFKANTILENRPITKNPVAGVNADEIKDGMKLKAIAVTERVLEDEAKVGKSLGEAANTKDTAGTVTNAAMSQVHESHSFKATAKPSQIFKDELENVPRFEDAEVVVSDSTQCDIPFELKVIDNEQQIRKDKDDNRKTTGSIDEVIENIAHSNVAATLKNTRKFEVKKPPADVSIKMTQTNCALVEQTSVNDAVNQSMCAASGIVKVSKQKIDENASEHTAKASYQHDINNAVCDFKQIATTNGNDTKKLHLENDSVNANANKESASDVRVAQHNINLKEKKRNAVKHDVMPAIVFNDNKGTEIAAYVNDDFKIGNNITNIDVYNDCKGIEKCKSQTLAEIKGVGDTDCSETFATTVDLEVCKPKGVHNSDSTRILATTRNTVGLEPSEISELDKCLSENENQKLHSQRNLEFTTNSQTTILSKPIDLPIVINETISEPTCTDYSSNVVDSQLIMLVGKECAQRNTSNQVVATSAVVESAVGLVTEIAPTETLSTSSELLAMDTSVEMAMRQLHEMDNTSALLPSACKCETGSKESNRVKHLDKKEIVAKQSNKAVAAVEQCVAGNNGLSTKSAQPAIGREQSQCTSNHKESLCLNLKMQEVYANDVEPIETVKPEFASCAILVNEEQTAATKQVCSEVALKQQRADVCSVAATEAATTTIVEANASEIFRQQAELNVTPSQGRIFRGTGKLCVLYNDSEDEQQQQQLELVSTAKRLLSPTTEVSISEHKRSKLHDMKVLPPCEAADFENNGQGTAITVPTHEIFHRSIKTPPKMTLCSNNVTTTGAAAQLSPRGVNKSIRPTDAKFNDIDTRLQSMFQLPVQEAIIPMFDAAVSCTATSHNSTFDESAISSVTSSDAQCTTANSTLMDTSVGSCEIKHVSFGSSDYRFERVSQNVVNLHITRKRSNKRKSSKDAATS